MKFIDPAKYQPQCETLFSEFGDKVQSLLPDAVIVHVGASSVPGLISKGDLDIYVGVDERHHADAVELLTQAGYAIKTDTLRTEQLCMLETDRKDVSLQVVARGSRFDDVFLSFNAKLRASEPLRDAYNQLKLESVDCSADDYRERKARFIEEALADE